MTDADRAEHDVIVRYECNACNYSSFVPDRNRWHYPNKAFPLPGRGRKKCTGAVGAVRYIREQLDSITKTTILATLRDLGPRIVSSSPVGDPMGIEHRIEWSPEAVADAIATRVLPPGDGRDS